MTNFSTPILLIIFNRPDTTQRVFDAIRQVHPQRLFVAADGPRPNNDGEKKLCEITRQIIKQVDWSCEVKTLFREENLGCGLAVSSAVTWFFEDAEEGIILEDDCLPIASFFHFCKLMLEKYRDNSQVGMIAGTNYLFGYDNFPYSYYFSKHCYVWGWATWKRAWALYDPLVENFPDYSFLKNYFNDRQSSDYYFNQFDYFKYHKIDTWDIQWCASLVKNKLYSIVPVNNQISNIGVTGTHAGKTASLSLNMPVKTIEISNIKHPRSLVYDKTPDLLSIRNIIYKVVRASFFKTLLVRVITRKNINLLKKIWPLKLYYYGRSKR